jgi:signal transduction histidine kinase
VTELDLNRLRHDIRTPLAVVTGFAELLASDGTITEEQRRDYATRIGQAALELRRLLDGADRLDRP